MKKRKFGHMPVRLAPMTDDTKAWRDALPQDRQISYALAAALWNVPIRTAIERVNRLVRSDVLRGVATGRFDWVREEKW